MLAKDAGGLCVPWPSIRVDLRGGGDLPNLDYPGYMEVYSWQHPLHIVIIVDVPVSQGADYQKGLSYHQLGGRCWLILQGLEP